jgi:peptidoglycan/LPS O-acetylase OafA/YrhL
MKNRGRHRRRGWWSRQFSARTVASEVDPGGRTRHWDALDGMRAFAVVAVMIFHFYIPTLLPGGFLGVDVFFVLSGFLITSLLIGEQGKYQRIDLKAFYIRRALRLLPALLAMMVVFTLVVDLVPSAQYYRHDSLTAIPFVLFYLGNWWRIGHSLGVFDHTWSLAIEEQFYILFPALFIFCMRRRMRRINIARALVVAALAEIVLRSILLAAGSAINTIDNTTVTHSDGLLLGAALAFWLTSTERRQIRAGTVHVFAVAAVVVLVALVAATSFASPFWYDFGITVAPIATVALLFDQVTTPQPWLAKVLGSKPAVWIGRRSYGLYLWHAPIYKIVILIPGRTHVRGSDVIVFVGSFFAAIVSFEIIEKPALRLKARFQKTEATPNSLASSIQTGRVGRHVAIVSEKSGLPAISAQPLNGSVSSPHR